MSTRAAIANTLWLAQAIPDALRFRAALGEPRDAQNTLLMDMLERHAASEYGEAFGFGGIGSVDDFVQRVPVTNHAALSPWIDRVHRGAPNVLACDLVTHLAPTSGSTGGRKLIPFTAELKSAFARAVNPWLVDLARRHPALIGGPAYWSVSPSLIQHDSGSGATRIGFDDDAEYLSGPAAWLVRQALAVPSSVRHINDEREFWRQTLLALLRREDLRFISIWHPTFLELMIAEAAATWKELLDAIPERDRADSLRSIGPEDWPRWWPHLQVLSCWGDQAATAGFERLRRRLPDVLVQAKGLLATEACVTIPIGGRFPVALTSHYFEFLDDSGDIRPLHALQRGARYEVVVTNGGGLWRYRLGDMVECTGHLDATPTLRFLGRAGLVSDLRGEKLADAFVADTMQALWGGSAPVVSELHAWEDDARAGYTLRVSDEVAPESLTTIASKCDDLLRANPHYAIARRLGQLAPVDVSIMSRDEQAAAIRSHRGRIGDAKPRVLVRTRARIG